MMTDLARNWWALALRGVAAVLFGLLALALPGATLAALVILFGAYALVDGAFALVTAARAVGRHAAWLGSLVEGVLGVAAGVAVFLWPGITTVALLALIALWAILTGIVEVVAAVRLRRELDGEWLLGLSGLVSILFGVVLLARPAAGALALIWAIGAYAILFGALLLGFAWRLRGRQAHSRTTPA